MFNSRFAICYCGVSCHSIASVRSGLIRLVAAVVLVSAVSVLLFDRFRTERSRPDDHISRADTGPHPKANWLEDRERAINETVWSKEMLAQKCGRLFEQLWDSLNTATNALHAAAQFPVGEVVLGNWKTAQPLRHGIQLRSSSGTGAIIAGNDWAQFVEQFDRDGWRLEQTEIRHVRFDVDDAGAPLRSRFTFAAHLTRERDSLRAAVDGDLAVEWGEQSSAGAAAVQRLDASQLVVSTWTGPPFFEQIMVEELTPAESGGFVDPLIVYDLDGDGFSEIILAAQNTAYWRQGPNSYRAEVLCEAAAGRIFTGMIADFDSDGSADFLCEQASGLVLFPGSDNGKFTAPGRVVWSPGTPLMNVMAMTCGDIDHDGDLDLFLGQYKNPTIGQILRPSYYDANDSYPAYLLLNDGRGTFSNGTAARGLLKKRFRRIFSASFADLNDDTHLDLMVVSDFAGIDLHVNDGTGTFTDVTHEWISESHGFGMGHTLSDFDRDGRLDFLMIGMNSPTVDRLEHLGLVRPGSANPGMRQRMAYGNRLYLGRQAGGFEQTRLSDSIARSGWSWGCSAFDFGNDGFPDVYIANGYQTKQTVRDYESEFWLHDIFIEDSVDDMAATGYFLNKFNWRLREGLSYGGYEKNRLYMNDGAQRFVDIGHLAGVALQQDSRNVVTDDLDADGRMDLVVTTFEVWPELRQTLRVYMNRVGSAGNWIGFRLGENDQRASPVGVQISLHDSWGAKRVRQLVTGDSFRSQHSTTAHFGLGTADAVTRAEFRWPSGAKRIIENPKLNRYHSIQP